MTKTTAARSPTVIIISAGRAPGPQVAAAFAAAGARVIAIDDDAKRLARVVLADPSRIEPLLAEGFRAQTLQLLEEAWGREPIDLVVNLMPMRRGGEISTQMRLLSMILRTMIRGLVAGQGSIVNVVPLPADRLALAAQGLWGAMRTGSAALGAELAAKSVRVHALAVPPETPELAADMLIHLGSDTARALKSTAFELE